jgi:hypothetical protein
VSIKVTLNKRAIAKEARRFRHVPGLRIIKLDRFEAKPRITTELEAPKDNRLRRPVDLITAA